MGKKTRVRIFLVREHARRFPAIGDKNVGRRSLELLKHRPDIVFTEERQRAVIQKQHLSPRNGKFHIGIRRREDLVGMGEDIVLDDLIESLKKEE